MTMDAITTIDIFNRLQTLGYMKDKESIEDLPRNDQNLIVFSIPKGYDSLELFLNRPQKSFEQIMRPYLIDIICAEFLDSKREIGIQDDGSISPTGAIKKIQEEQLKVEYDTSSSTAYRDVSTPFDKMIEYLRNNSYLALQNFRYHYPYYRWYNLEDDS